MPNSILEKPWRHISAGFIVKLPLAQGYNAILVVCDCLTKIVHFIPTIEKTSVAGLAKLFRDNVWKLHGCQEANYSLSALDKENSLESSLYWSVYLYIIYLVYVPVILHSQPNYV